MVLRERDRCAIINATWEGGNLLEMSFLPDRYYCISVIRILQQSDSLEE